MLNLNKCTKTKPKPKPTLTCKKKNCSYVCERTTAHNYHTQHSTEQFLLSSRQSSLLRWRLLKGRD